MWDSSTTTGRYHKLSEITMQRRCLHQLEHLHTYWSLENTAKQPHQAAEARSTKRKQGPSNLTPALHKLPDDSGQQSQAVRSSSGGGQAGQAAILGLADSGEADVVLLDDGGVQAVEVQQQHVLVVQALLGLQNQPSCVLGGTPLLPTTCRGPDSCVRHCVICACCDEPG